MVSRLTDFFPTALILTLFITGCSSPVANLEYKRAEMALQKQDYPSALKHLHRVIKRNPKSELGLEATRKAARISLFQVENFPQAVEFYSSLVLYSKDDNERKDAQRNIAQIYFDKMANYNQAVSEFQKLLNFRISAQDEMDSRLALAKSYYYLKDFYQAKVELEQMLKKTLTPKDRFQSEFLLGNIQLAAKDVAKSLETFTRLKAQYPELAQEEKIDMTIAVCYEEMNDFPKAIETLEKFKESYSQPEFIDLKIRRLKDRAQNLPGAKGFRK